MTDKMTKLRQDLLNTNSAAGYKTDPKKMQILDSHPDVNDEMEKTNNPGKMSGMFRGDEFASGSGGGGYQQYMPNMPNLGNIGFFKK